MQEGKDITLVAFGKLVGYNLKAAEELKKDGISCEVQDLRQLHQYPNTFSSSIPLLRSPDNWSQILSLRKPGRPAARAVASRSRLRIAKRLEAAQLDFRCSSEAVWQAGEETFETASHEILLRLQVINIRTLKPLDRETIVNSVKKTHRLVAVEEGWPQCGVTAEIIATVNEECFDDLDAPPERITGAEVPMPYAANLEKAALPQISDVVRVVKRVMGKK